MTRFSRFRRKLSSLRLDWTFPKRIDVLIFFTDTSRQLSSYFPDRRIAVVDLESPQRNFWVLLLSAMSGSIRIRRYMSTYVLLTKPELVLSAQDNFEPLWHLRPKTRTAIALVQNGLRVDDLNSLPAPSTSSKRGPHVDYYFCFNSTVGNFVGKTLRADYIPIGSFRSNYEPRISDNPIEKLSYISTFRADIPLTSLIQTSRPGEHVTYGALLERRIEILTEVAAFCQTKGLIFEILGKDLDHDAEESFFKERLGQYQFTFKPRKPNTFQYRQCDSARIVVSTGSTLGLESLSRRNRTAVFDPIAMILGNPSFQFGWPVLSESEGPFWSAQASPTRIRDVLEFLFAASESQWDQTLNSFSDALPLYDPGNSIFVNQLNRYGAKLQASNATPYIQQ